MSDADVVDEELRVLARERPAHELMTLSRELVTLLLQTTPVKRVVVNVQFPAGYPAAAGLHFQLTSSQLGDASLSKLHELAQRRLSVDCAGQPQLLSLARLLDRAMRTLMLLPCVEDIAALRRTFADLATDDRAGCVLFSVRSNAGDAAYEHRSDVRACVPDAYPAEPVRVTVVQSTLPAALVDVIVAHANEEARKLSNAQPPKPSLVEAVTTAHSVADSIATAVCQVCALRVLPARAGAGPLALPPAGSRDSPERLYCGHWYHLACVDKYLHEPPFVAEGKPCLVCRRRVLTQRWDADHKTLERRWASKQAKQREVEDVADMLDL